MADGQKSTVQKHDFRNRENPGDIIRVLLTSAGFCPRNTVVSYLQLAYLHLASILPAFALGTYLLLAPKGSERHRLLGKIYMLLMLSTALITLFMKALVGPLWLNHFGYIHLLSVLVLISVPAAYRAARRGKIRQHRGHMLGLYFGALWVAGSLALTPGRLLHGWLFG